MKKINSSYYFAASAFLSFLLVILFILNKSIGLTDPVFIVLLFCADGLFLGIGAGKRRYE